MKISDLENLWLGKEVNKMNRNEIIGELKKLKATPSGNARMTDQELMQVLEFERYLKEGKSA